jgi:hypothetical protein
VKNRRKTRNKLLGLPHKLQNHNFILALTFFRAPTDTEDIEKTKVRGTFGSPCIRRGKIILVGLSLDLNPGPRAPKARIIPLDMENLTHGNEG